MAIQDTLDSAHSNWMEAEGPESEVVISSRVRLARNLAGYPFPHQMSQETGGEVVRLMQGVIADPGTREQLGPLFYVPLEELSPLDRQILVEKHLISPQHAGDERPNRGLILRPDEAVSILVNEEDHLRIQVLHPALQLQAAWDLANRVDDTLDAKLDYAFDEQYGFLSCCPTNVGTGLRASVMMHLPALAMSGQARGVFTALSKLGFVVRGLYGEGTEAKGNLFQVSNQITLGSSEQEIVDSLAAVSRQVIEQEQLGRRSLMQERQPQVEDMVYRAYGVLTNARIVSADEAMFYLSCLRFGIDLGLLHNVNRRTLNELLVRARGAFLQKGAGKEMNELERNIERASVIREALAAGGAAC